MALFANSSGSPFPVGNNPVDNATADLNGDGHLDLLLTNYISDNVSVLLGDGHGGFVAGTPVAVTNGPRAVVVGDLDGDGDIDFTAANYSGNNITVALNNGNGTFVTSSVPVGLVPRYVVLGDLDGDGDLDMVASNYGSNNLSVMLNNGHGVFAAAIGSPVSVGTRPIEPVLADFDGDHDLDIAVTNNSNNNVTILLNNGSAGFTAASGSPVAVGSSPRGMAAGDIDRDGDTDLAVVNFLGNNVTILLNDGHGHFTAAGATVPTGNNPYNVTLADIDGDHDLDMAVTNSGSSSLSVFLNDGQGNFTPEANSPYAVGVSPGGVVAADFNHDGLRDLATANFGSNTTSVLLNTMTHLVGTPGADSFTASGTQLIEALGGTDTITFNFRLVDATFTFQDNVIIVDGPSTHAVISGFERFVFTDGTVDNRDGSPLIDDLFYYSRYHDVWNAHVDADTHFNTFGFHEGRDPNAFFDTRGYLAAYPDVAAAGVNPLTHYDQFGFREGRDPSKQFDTAQYLSHNPDVGAAHVDPLKHFLEFGYDEGRLPFGDGAFH
jgi:hypothetical protein